MNPRRARTAETQKNALPAVQAEQHAGHREPEPAPDAERCAHEGDTAARAVRREHLLGDAHAERDDGNTETLQGAPDDQRQDRRGEGRDDRPDGEHRQTGEHHPPFAVHVTEPAEHGGRWPDNNAEVATHDTSLTDAPRRFGSSDRRGRATDWVIDTSAPQ